MVIMVMVMIPELVIPEPQALNHILHRARSSATQNGALRRRRGKQDAPRATFELASGLSISLWVAPVLPYEHVFRFVGQTIGTSNPALKGPLGNLVLPLHKRVALLESTSFRTVLLCGK